MHTTQTAGLALATDLAPAATRPRVVAFLYVMLLIGMVASATVFGRVLTQFNEVHLIQVIQGTALLTMILNIVALWKQEVRDPSRATAPADQPSFRESWRSFCDGGRSSRVLLAVGFGTAGFSMQDILLEPYGGEILHLSVGATTALTALLACGTLCAFAISARSLKRGADPYRLAGYGALVGVIAFSAVIFSAPFESPTLFRIGATLIGFGGGLFAVGTLTGAMALAENGASGLALGAWGAVQASAAGIAIALGGAIRDAVASLATEGALGPALTSRSVGYGMVYYFEIILLFVTLAIVGPLVRSTSPLPRDKVRFGLTEFPG
jgi:BCD family chlorophyll transporter-like MFS transporter